MLDSLFIVVLPGDEAVRTRRRLGTGVAVEDDMEARDRRRSNLALRLGFPYGLPEAKSNFAGATPVYEEVVSTYRPDLTDVCGIHLHGSLTVVD
jgi:hypothetical protein